MSDATIQSGESSGRKIDPGFTRNMKIVGGFLAVMVIVVVLIVMKATSGSSASNATAITIDQGMATNQQKTEQAQTPAMQAKLQSIQLAEAATAQKEGRSYVPTEAIGSIEPVPTSAPQTSPIQQTSQVPTASTMQVSNSGFATGNGMSQDQMQSIREGLRTQLAMIVPAQVNAGSPRQSLSFKDDSAKKDDTKTSPTTSASSNSAPASASQGSSSTPALISALDIVAAKLANPITAIMGKPSYASATLETGALKGAFLVGTSTLNENETIETTFTLMKLGSKAYKIDAIVLDEQTADAGVKGDLDRRILQRYIMPVALAVAQGYYTAASQTGSTVLAVTTGTAATSSPAPTMEQARNAGIASGLGIAGKEVQKAANESIRSTMKREMPVGILFRAAVKDEIK